MKNEISINLSESALDQGMDRSAFTEEKHEAKYNWL